MFYLLEHRLKRVLLKKGDYVDDVLQVIRTDVSYEFAPNWKFHWATSYRQADQDFDHFYGGTYCASDATTSNGESASSTPLTQRRCYNNVGKISQNYCAANHLMKPPPIRGIFQVSLIRALLNINLLVGTDWTYEQREPKTF